LLSEYSHQTPLRRRPCETDSGSSYAVLTMIGIATHWDYWESQDWNTIIVCAIVPKFHAETSEFYYAGSW